MKRTSENSARISDRERGFLNRALAHDYSAWILCLWWHKTAAGQDCELMHLVPWAEWKQIEADLEAKAAGNFKGKSIRRRIDLKAGGTSTPSAKSISAGNIDKSHWLRASLNLIDPYTQGDA